MSHSPSEIVRQDQARVYGAANSAIERMQAEGRSFSGYERNCVFLNMKDGKFADISSISGLDFIDDGRGAGFVDWDHDGDLDLWLRNRTAPQLRYMRNDTPADNHFLSIHLEGRTCNRDAIGARVEVHLGEGSGTLLRTLCAGHGFLSQSSKWLHFGLGSSQKIDKLVVRWPGAKAETFTGLETDRHYRIVENSGETRPWTRPDGMVALASSTLEGKPAKAGGRSILATGPLVPNLTYRDQSGAEVDLRAGLNGPTLVNLWASWCVPCRGEFKQWIGHRQQLQDAGLNILALSVDGVDPSKQTGAEDAWQLLKEMEFPFDAGLVDGRFLARLQIVSDVIFGRVISLAVPTSFLIDSEKRVAAVYRGTVEVETLLEDLQMLKAGASDRRKLAVPFAGRWFQDPQRMDMGPLVGRMTEEGFIDDALLYLRDQIIFQPENADINGRIGALLRAQGDLPGAVKALSKAVEISPNSYPLRIELAEVMLAMKALPQAVEQFKEALRIDPESAHAHAMLGRLMIQGWWKTPDAKLDQAIKHFREAVRIAPENAEVQRLLGTVLNHSGDIAGIKHLEKAVKLRPDHALGRMNLGDAFLQLGKPNDAAIQFQEALELANKAGDKNLINLLRQRLESERNSEQNSDGP